MEDIKENPDIEVSKEQAIETVEGQPWSTSFLQGLDRTDRLIDNTQRMCKRKRAIALKSKNKKYIRHVITVTRFEGARRVLKLANNDSMVASMLLFSYNISKSLKRRT